MAKTLAALSSEVAALTSVVETLVSVVTGEVTMAPVSSAPAKSRFVRTVSIEDGTFGAAIGDDLSGWTLVDVLDALRGDGEVGDLDYDAETGVVSGLPAGWAFGPKALNYLATGEFE